MKNLKRILVIVSFPFLVGSFLILGLVTGGENNIDIKRWLELK